VNSRRGTIARVRFRAAAFLACSVLANLLVVAAPSEHATAHHDHQFTQGTINGTANAAQDVISQSTCAGLTAAKLQAMALSITPTESGLNPSPMALSRFDTLAVSSSNLMLYSYGTESGQKRAHWNPGVGIFQLDTWSVTADLNHRQRANTSTAGRRVMAELRDKFCQGGENSMWSFVYQNWFGCQQGSTNICRTTYIDHLFRAGALRVAATSGSDWAGGVALYDCRIGTGPQFNCYFYDMGNAQGAYDGSDPNGTGGTRSPLSEGFYGYSLNGTKTHYWPSSLTGYPNPINRTIASASSGRSPTNGWVSGPPVLSRRSCAPGGSCSWVPVP